MPEAAVAKLFARLPGFADASKARRAFRFPSRAVPPPTDPVETRPFRDFASNTPAPQAVQAEPLQVVRYAPQGEVAQARHVRITFSQPMVSVSSHAMAVQSAVPVTLTPEIPGSWRWVGTRTLIYEPDGLHRDPHYRLPMATTYRVEIPKGMRSASGAELPEDVAFELGTPPPRVEQLWPNGAEERLSVKPVFMAAFDQRVDAAAVLGTVRIEGPRRTFAVRAASQDDLEASPSLMRVISRLRAEGRNDGQDSTAHRPRRVMFRVEETLAPNTSYAVAIGPGTPSAEGNRKTQRIQRFSFQTHGPLAIEEQSCMLEGCPPDSGWTVELNHRLDPDSLQADGVRISPPVDDAEVFVAESTVRIRAPAKPGTRYRVTLPASTRDVFGQTLGAPRHLHFDVGPPHVHPRISAQEGMVIVDPAAGAPTYTVRSMDASALEVVLCPMKPPQWTQLAKTRGTKRRPSTFEACGSPKTRPVAGSHGTWVETPIDLSAAMGQDAKGHVLVFARPAASGPDGDWVHAWVQSTDIAVDAFLDDSRLMAWATRLKNGRPVTGATLELLPQGIETTTNEEGLGELTLPAREAAQEPQLLVARHGPDVAILPSRRLASGRGSWFQKEPGSRLQWFVFDDRHIYQPGEKVHVKGWLRRIGAGVGGDVRGLDGSVERISYEVTGPRRRTFTKGEVTLSALDGFDLTFTLPEASNLGGATLKLTAHGDASISSGTASHLHGFEIRELRRPEFEVRTRASQGPHFVGETADVTVEASYYAGGALPGADVRWLVTTSPAVFRPPNRDDYRFGTASRFGFGLVHGLRSGPRFRSLEGKTDTNGSHVLRLGFLSAEPPEPSRVTATAIVHDVNQQTWRQQTSLLVHPADLYVGLRMDDHFVEEDEPLEVDTLVVNHDGVAVEGARVEVEAIGSAWERHDDRWHRVDTEPQRCTVISRAASVRCSFRSLQPGSYRIVATVHDERGRPSQTHSQGWVGPSQPSPERQLEMQAVTLVPHKPHYQPGESASVAIHAPFAPAEALLSVRRSGIVTTRRFRMKDATTTVEIPIESHHVPNAYIQVDLVGAAPRRKTSDDPSVGESSRPAYAAGRLVLDVPPQRRRLDVDVVPQDAVVDPGGRTLLDVSVRDSEGRPVRRAEVAVAVVDEAVLAWSGYETPDPMEAFYQRRPERTRNVYARRFLQRASSPRRRGTGYSPESVPTGAIPTYDGTRGRRAPAGARKRAGPSLPSSGYEVRDDFKPWALFAPNVHTDRQGHARVTIDVPDNLTRYRAIAVAAAGEKRFGHGEANITARLPLMARPSPPRFLHAGDELELPVLVQNRTDEALDIQVAVRARNATLTDGHGRRLRIPAHDRLMVRFAATAEHPGSARFQVLAASKRFADAHELSVPIWTPAHPERFAAYGVLDEGATRHIVEMPEHVNPQIGGLELTTASTQAHGLSDALRYLLEYPYDSVEPTASRVLAVAATRDVVDTFPDDAVPKPRELDARIERDVQSLVERQHADGGFGLWGGKGRTIPYVSIHAAHALCRAEARGYAVPQRALDAAKAYLRDIVQKIPDDYAVSAKHTLAAYALYVRNRMGDHVTRTAMRLLDEAGLQGLSIEALGWLFGTLTGRAEAQSALEDIERQLRNHVSETASTAHFVARPPQDAPLWFHAERRKDAVALEALIEHAPESDLIAKLVRGLLAARTRGRWQNTQENAFAILALGRHFRTFERSHPDFVARAWLGARFLGAQRFDGRHRTRIRVEVPMRHLLASGATHTLTLQKQGKGRLYYRIGMKYAPQEPARSASSHGFSMARRYEAIGDPDEVQRRPDGTWEIAAGAAVRVRLTMLADGPRHHVVLVDSLPAGLEPVHPGHAPRAAERELPSVWAHHQNMRDTGLEAFASHLSAGIYHSSYVVRAATTGDFIAPSAKVEAMYAPETFGRSGSDRVVVN